MRLKALLLRSSLPAIAILIAACAGGGGSYSGDYQDTQDRPPALADSAINKTTERTKLLNESIVASGEATTTGTGASSGGTNVGGFNCLGTFSCTASTNVPGAKTSSKAQKLSLPGICSYEGSGFNPDGTITSKGQVIGTWQVTSTGFRISESVTVTSGKTSTTVTVALDCTKISDTFDPNAIGSGDDDDDIQAPPETNGTNGSDAGVRQ